MSVVVAVRDGNSVWIGCDSQVTQGYTSRTLNNPNNSKIFRTNDDKNTIVGVVGFLRDRDILYCEDNLLNELDIIKGNINFKYIVKTFVPRLFKIMMDNDRILKDEKTLKYINSVFILAHKEKIFQISEDGAVSEIDDFVAVGSGHNLCRGSLNVTTEKNKKQMVIDAVKSACESDIFVNYPIIIMNTMTDEIETIYKDR